MWLDVIGSTGTLPIFMRQMKPRRDPMHSRIEAAQQTGHTGDVRVTHNQFVSLAQKIVEIVAERVLKQENHASGDS